MRQRSRRRDRRLLLIINAIVDSKTIVYINIIAVG